MPITNEPDKQEEIVRSIIAGQEKINAKLAAPRLDERKRKKLVSKKASLKRGLKNNDKPFF